MSKQTLGRAQAALIAFGLVAMAGLSMNVVAQDAELPPESEQERTRRTTLGAVYPEDSTVRVTLVGTSRLPGASGEAKVERKRGRTEIEIKLRNMKPATLFGGDYNTYVLWTVSPEGLAVNNGEFVLRGNRSELVVSTSLSSFGMFVTAEPHFLVAEPSEFVVLENSDASPSRGRVEKFPVEYEAFRGVYKFERQSLADEPEINDEFRVERHQALTAVRLAERAGAPRYAPEELVEAQKALRETVEAFQKGLPESQFSSEAHRAIRWAVLAERLAERRAREAEREACRNEVTELKQAKEEAEEAAREARQAAERAQEEAAQASRERDEALEARAKALESARLAQVQYNQAQDLMVQARIEAERFAELKAQAEKEAAEARARLKSALETVAETRETAEGLVVNLPDILFASGKSTLQPRMREILSQIAGVLLATPSYRLRVEGHTDSTGGEALNERLSERRAQNVREYLVEAGLSPEAITAIGYGESQPIADNSTAQGRRRNRRVEIIISQESGQQAAASTR